MNSPVAASSPALRAEETPPFSLWMTRAFAFAFAYSSQMRPLWSVEPSSTSRSSMSSNVCAESESRQRGR